MANIRSLVLLDGILTPASEYQHQRRNKHFA